MRQEPYQLGVVDAARAIRQGDLSAVELVSSCLDRIDARERQVKAWVHIDREGALAAAGDADARQSRGETLGALHGIPVGIKDIFDVSGMPTRAGTDAYVMRIAQADATSVQRLRDAGAIVLGKTVTTAYAMSDPGPTTNPWNKGHTPGGSSSGSAAGTADFMCLAALGSQTAGSVLRPAAFNGVVGFKPTHGAISVEGVVELSANLDHVGCFTRSVEDAWVLWRSMANAPPAVPASSIGHCPHQMPRAIWRWRAGLDAICEPSATAALDRVCDALRRDGVDVVEISRPLDMDAMFDAHAQIMAADAARFHRSNFAQRESLYPPRIAELVRTGLTTPAVGYIEALRTREEWRTTLSRTMEEHGVDAVLMPPATGAAPRGLDFTGDRRANLLASFTGLPAITLPINLDGNGLPIGAQLMGLANDEDGLLAKAAWIHRAITANS
ncbi:MAG: amidase [Chromatiales bacterium]|jgi:Asp-tRNA(Asn)/Glu-tRNA(Gln) amidotransferase A subunit family amidase|nr:amidase [Chromatiales bacterium]